MKFPIAVTNKLIIIPFKEDTVKTESGLYMPTEHTNEPYKGKVISIGPDVKTVKEGDIVCKRKETGWNFDLGQKSYMVMREDEVWAVIKN